MGLLGLIAILLLADCANNRPRVINPSSAPRRVNQQNRDNDQQLNDREIERAVERKVNELLLANGANNFNDLNLLGSGLDRNALDSSLGAQNRPEDIRAIQQGLGSVVTDSSGRFITDRNNNSNFAFNSGFGSFAPAPNQNISSGNSGFNPSHGNGVSNSGSVLRRPADPAVR